MQGYHVTPVTGNDASIARDIVPKRRGLQTSAPSLSLAANVYVGDTLFGEFGLTELVGCSTVEAHRRPIPHVFETSETRKLTQLFEQRYPLVLDRVRREMAPCAQVYSTKSRTGWPFFVRDDKMAYLRPEFERVMREGMDAYEDGLISMNVRLQAEARTKKRDFLFIDAQGTVYPATI